jgi:hypothetical protein
MVLDRRVGRGAGLVGPARRTDRVRPTSALKSMGERISLAFRVKRHRAGGSAKDGVYG